MPGAKRSNDWLAVSLAVIALPVCAAAEVDGPDVTPERLPRIESPHGDIVYLQDAASLQRFSKVYLVECTVTFRENWKKDYNQTVADVRRRVSDKDMARIQSRLSGELGEVFTREFENAGFEIATGLSGDVLILRPALINIDITAPEGLSQNNSYSVVNSAATLTLYVELYDGTTNTKVAMFLDSRTDRETVVPRANRTTNRAATDRMLRHWANRLIEISGGAREGSRN